MRVTSLRTEGEGREAARQVLLSMVSRAALFQQDQTFLMVFRDCLYSLQEEWGGLQWGLGLTVQHSHNHAEGESMYIQAGQEWGRGESMCRLYNIQF